MHRSRPDSPDAPRAAGEAEKRTPSKARLGGAIYGQVLATSTVAALTQDSSLGSTDDLIALTGTVLVFWIAHAYAEVLAAAVATTQVLSLAEIRRVMVDQWPIAQSALPAAVPLALAAVGVWSDDTGATLAVTFGILALGGWGAIIARRTGRSWPGTIVIASLSAALGLGVVGLMALVH